MKVRKKKSTIPGRTMMARSTPDRLKVVRIPTGQVKYLSSKLAEKVGRIRAAQARVRVVHVNGKRTVSTLNAAVEGQFEACAFSEDDKYVLAHTGAPDHVIVVWKWADERPVGRRGAPRRQLDVKCRERRPPRRVAHGRLGRLVGTEPLRPVRCPE